MAAAGEPKITEVVDGEEPKITEVDGEDADGDAGGDDGEGGEGGAPDMAGLEAMVAGMGGGAGGEGGAGGMDMSASMSFLGEGGGKGGGGGMGGTGGTGCMGGTGGIQVCDKEWLKEAAARIAAGKMQELEAKIQEIEAAQYIATIQEARASTWTQSSQEARANTGTQYITGEGETETTIQALNEHLDTLGWNCSWLRDRGKANLRAAGASTPCALPQPPSPSLTQGRTGPSSDSDGLFSPEAEAEYVADSSSEDESFSPSPSLTQGRPGPFSDSDGSPAPALGAACKWRAAPVPAPSGAGGLKMQARQRRRKMQKMAAEPVAARKHVHGLHFRQWQAVQRRRKMQKMAAEQDCAPAPAPAAGASTPCAPQRGRKMQKTAAEQDCGSRVVDPDPQLQGECTHCGATKIHVGGDMWRCEVDCDFPISRCNRWAYSLPYHTTEDTHAVSLVRRFRKIVKVFSKDRQTVFQR